MMGPYLIEWVSIGSPEETLATMKHGNIDLRLVNDAITRFSIKRNKATMAIRYDILKKYLGIEVFQLIPYLVDSKACFQHGKAVLFRLCPDSGVTVSAHANPKENALIGAVVSLHFKVVPFLLDP